MILIVSIDDDLHALAVQAELNTRGLDCKIVATDTLTGTRSVDISISPSGRVEMTLLATDGSRIKLSDIRLIWLRRPKALQLVDSESGLNEHHTNLINSDIQAGLNGGLQCAFTGIWISDPRCTERASNKLIQLVTAQRCGLNIPDTLVSQNPESVRSFYEKQAGRIIVKPVAGTPGPILFTQLVSPEHLAAIDSIGASPAIYQQCIAGRRHIRLNCFGDKSYASSIDTDRLDWRPDLSVPVKPWDVPTDLHRTVRNMLDALGLEMGIFDFKEGADGTLYFFEVNPQGQFLFLEGLTREPLIEAFADFICSKLDAHGNRAIVSSTG